MFISGTTYLHLTLLCCSIGKKFPHKHIYPYVYMPGGPGKEGKNGGELNLHFTKRRYKSGTVNSKSFVSKVLLQIKWKFELN